MNKMLLLIAFFISVNKSFSQFINSSSDFDSSNITIKDSVLRNVINGFFNFTLKEKAVPSLCFAAVSLVKQSDSATYIEISLYLYSMANKVRQGFPFYGYAAKNNFFFVFMNGHEYVERDSSILNPSLFKPEVLSSSKKIPLPNYDPYKWELILKKDKIIRMEPKATIENYLTSY